MINFEEKGEIIQVLLVEELEQQGNKNLPSSPSTAKIS